MVRIWKKLMVIEFIIKIEELLFIIAYKNCMNPNCIKFLLIFTIYYVILIEE